MLILYFRLHRHKPTLDKEGNHFNNKVARFVHKNILLQQDESILYKKFGSRQECNLCKAIRVDLEIRTCICLILPV